MVDAFPEVGEHIFGDGESDINLVVALQTAHDESDGPESFKRDLRKVADDFDLDMPKSLR